MRVKVGDINIECVQGDITNQVDVDCVVNAANAHLAPGGGVAGAIHRKAGSELYEECKKLAPIKTGEAVITRGYNLPNKYVIHTLGPVYNKEQDSAQKLKLCYKNCLRVAEKNRLRSMAFCAISTGIFGYPLEAAADVAIHTVLEEIPRMKSLRIIRFVLYDSKSLKIFEEMLKRTISSS